jgi:hypothetical protein
VKVFANDQKKIICGQYYFYLKLDFFLFDIPISFLEFNDPEVLQL